MLQDENLDAFGYSSDEKQWLREFYAKRKFSPLWVNDSCLTERGIELQTAMGHSLWFGIPENRVKNPDFESKIFVRDEILLTANASFMIRDLDSGFMNLAEKKYNNRSFAPQDNMHKLLKKSIPLDSVFLQRGPLDSTYRFFASHLYN